MADPFRDRRFTGPEVRRIVRRAVDLSERGPDVDGEWSVGQAELERAAGELGLSRDVLARAMSGPDPAIPSAPGDASWFLGAPTRLVLERAVQGELSESDREDVIEDIREALGEAGTIDRVGKTMTWKLTPVYGRAARELSVTFRSRDGRTRIVINERLTRQATGLFAGLGLGAGLGPMGGFIAAIAKLGPLGIVFPLLWIPLMLLLARTIFVALVARRRRTLGPLMAQLEERSRHWTGGAEAALRVASPTRDAVRSRVDPAEGDDEAAADATAAARSLRRS